MAESIPTEQVTEITRSIEHPEIAATFGELGMIGTITTQENRISIELLVPFPNIPITDYLAGMVEKIIKEKFPEATVSFVFSVMDEETRSRFLATARQHWKGEI